MTPKQVKVFIIIFGGHKAKGLTISDRKRFPLFWIQWKVLLRSKGILDGPWGGQQCCRLSATNKVRMKTICFQVFTITTKWCIAPISREICNNLSQISFKIGNLNKTCWCNKMQKMNPYLLRTLSYLRRSGVTPMTWAGWSLTCPPWATSRRPSPSSWTTPSASRSSNPATRSSTRGHSATSPSRDLRW